jgi:hypothetical protein
MSTTKRTKTLNSTTEESKMECVKLFRVSSVADQLRGHKNVQIQWFVDERPRRLFGAGGSANVTYHGAIKHYDPDHPLTEYAQTALAEYFTEGEASAFVEWLKAHRNDTTATVEQATLPIEKNAMPFSAMPVGGENDFLMTGRSADYNLPFKVWGYFDLRGCERAT